MEEADKETWETGSKAAAAGGVTCVVDQPNTEPPTSDSASLERKLGAAERSFVDYCLNGALTDSSRLEELAPLVAAFGEAFMADGKLRVTELGPLLDSAAALGKLCTVHAEEGGAVDRGTSRYGGGSPLDYSEARPEAAERGAVEEAAASASDSGARVHICHASTPGGAKRASRSGLTAECTPHHLLLNRTELDREGALAKCNPPLRKESTREELWKTFREGDLLLASDHAPHRKEGTDFWEAPAGVPGVQTGVPVLMAEASAGRIPLGRVVEASAELPARLLGLPKGRIEPGMDADLAIYDLGRVEEVGSRPLHSKAGYSLFEGWAAVFPLLTMVRGRTVYEDGAFRLAPGRFIQGKILK